MAINLVKGQKIDLTKNNAGLKKLLVGLGWDPYETKGFFAAFKQNNIDIDASVIMLRDDKLVDKKDLVYFGHLKSECGGVVHTGDNLTGDGDGDDEQIIVDLMKVNQAINRLVFVINIYDCTSRKQNFGMIKNAFIRVADYNNNSNIATYDLSSECKDCTAMVVAEVYRHNNEWKFSAVGRGTNDTSLGDMLSAFK